MCEIIRNILANPVFIEVIPIIIAMIATIAIMVAIIMIDREQEGDKDE